MSVTPISEAGRNLRLTSRAAQGLPPVVDDADALRRVAILVIDARRAARRAKQSAPAEAQTHAGCQRRAA